VETVPVSGLDAQAVLAIELDARGRIVNVSAKTPPRHAESPDERAARELAEGVSLRLRHIGTPHEALRRARMAVDLLENLVALEEALGPEARQLLAAEAAR
jgi:hypothetical protein